MNERSDTPTPLPVLVSTERKFKKRTTEPIGTIGHRVNAESDSLL
jgi:hypothetical protein